VTLLNSTCYSTRELKKMFTRIAKDELAPEKAKRVRFKIVYSKEGRHSGCAYVGGTLGTLRLPKPPHKIDPVKVALVIAHEMAHLRGLHHNQMRGNFSYNWTDNRYRNIYSWANDIVILVKIPNTKPTVPYNEAKLSHAMKNARKERRQAQAHANARKEVDCQSSILRKKSKNRLTI